MAKRRRDADGQGVLFRERYWTDHELIRDRLHVPGGPVAKLLLWMIFSRMGFVRDTWLSSNDELAGACNCSLRTFRRARKQLKDASLIDYEPVAGRAGWCRYRVIRSNLHDFLEPQPAARQQAKKPAAAREKQAKKSATRFDANSAEIPAALNTPGFRNAWSEWCKARKSRRKSVSKSAAARQLAKLEKAGVAASIEAIEASIANDWQGLFPEKFTGPRHTTSAARVTTRGDYGHPKPFRLP